MWKGAQFLCTQMGLCPTAYMQKTHNALSGSLGM